MSLASPRCGFKQSEILPSVAPSFWSPPNTNHPEKNLTNYPWSYMPLPQFAPVNNQPMFVASGGNPLSYSQHGNQVTWNFSLELRRAEDDKP